MSCIGELFTVGEGDMVNIKAIVGDGDTLADVDGNVQCVGDGVNIPHWTVA